MKKVVVITGASSPLGRVIARYLESCGYKIYASYFSSQYISNTESIVPIKIDVTDESSCTNAVAQIYKESGKIDVLVNIAGITKVGSFENSKLIDLDKLLDVNVKGVYRMIKAVIPYMKKQKNGKIINISSMSGLVAFPNFSIYSASKFALEGLTNSIRYELFKDNIQVTNINPGAIKKESKNITKMPHKTFREKFPIVGFMMPLAEAKTVALVVEKIIESQTAPPNVLVGSDVKIVQIIRKVTPSFVFDMLLKFIWSK